MNTENPNIDSTEKGTIAAKAFPQHQWEVFMAWMSKARDHARIYWQKLLHSLGLFWSKSSKLVQILAIAAIALLLVVLFYRYVSGEDIRHRWVRREHEIIDQWLTTQAKGRKGAEFWLADATIQRKCFNAVTQWEIVDEPGPGQYIVRVHSSNEPGIPVIHLWNITLQGDRTTSGDRYDPKIARVTDVFSE